ncbi:MAG: hypothetical protein OXH98_14445 [Caldilineaceae bacterium]|nr:hypothetical protein [Caldilineaceae bacterium]
MRRSLVLGLALLLSGMVVMGCDFMDGELLYHGRLMSPPPPVSVDKMATPFLPNPEGVTKSFVQSAIGHYDEKGLDIAVKTFSSQDSGWEQWYIYILDEEGTTIASRDEEAIGRDLSWRVDEDGYFYGGDMLSATEEGKWVVYVTYHPSKEIFLNKRVWVVQHDGLFFASGYYEEE